MLPISKKKKKEYLLSLPGSPKTSWRSTSSQLGLSTLENEKQTSAGLNHFIFINYNTEINVLS